MTKKMRSNCLKIKRFEPFRIMNLKNGIYQSLMLFQVLTGNERPREILGVTLSVS